MRRTKEGNHVAEMKDVMQSILLLTIRIAKFNGRLVQSHLANLNILQEAKKIRKELRRLIKAIEKMKFQPGSGTSGESE